MQNNQKNRKKRTIIWEVPSFVRGEKPQITRKKQHVTYFGRYFFCLRFCVFLCTYSIYSFIGAAFSNDCFPFYIIILQLFFLRLVPSPKSAFESPDYTPETNMEPEHIHIKRRNIYKPQFFGFHVVSFQDCKSPKHWISGFIAFDLSSKTATTTGPSPQVPFGANQSVTSQGCKGGETMAKTIAGVFHKHPKVEQHTVDGSEIRHSPVEVDPSSLSHHLQGTIHPTGGCLRFLPSTVS